MKKRFNNQKIAMSLAKYVVLFFMLTFVFVTQAGAQVFDDWVARPNVSVKYKINKKLNVGGTYYLYLDQNMSRFDKSVIAGEIGYKITKWMKAGFEYRYGTGNNEHYNDLRYSLSFDANLSPKLKIKYRPMLQQEFVSLKQSHLELQPVEYFLRNRITLDYNVTNRLELYVFTENYLKWKEDALPFSKQKSALGAEFEINQHNAIGARFEVINKKNGKLIARPNLSYTYTFGYIKRK